MFHVIPNMHDLKKFGSTSVEKLCTIHFSKQLQ